MSANESSSSRTAADVNREFYERRAKGRDDYWRKMAAPRHRVATLLELLVRDGRKRVIDLGCGNGQLLEEVHARIPGAQCAGIDLSEAQTADNRRAKPWAEFHAMDLDRPATFPEALRGKFDAVVATEVIEHLDAPAEFLRNALALAEPVHGRLYLSTQSGPLRETERRVGHRRHFTTGDIESLLRDTGWRPERVWNTGFPFHDLSKWYANLDADGNLSRFDDKPYGLREDLICWALRQAFRFNSRSRGAQLFAVASRPTT